MNMRFLEARSMPQASLRAYFRNDYKGGGVFKHDAYEHDPTEWCWIHKSSGIKARPARFDAFRPATLWRSRLAPTPQQQLLAGLAGCPGPDSVQWKWRSRVLLSLHDSVGVPKHHGSTEESRWSLRAALPISMSCDVMCLFARSPCRWPQPWASKGLVGHHWSEGQCVVGTRQGHIHQSWQNVSICRPLCPLQTTLTRRLQCQKGTGWMARRGHADWQ